LIISLLIVLAFIAIFDFIWQKYQHVEKLKMTIKEVKDEHKDTDGSPEVKQKLEDYKMKLPIELPLNLPR